MFKKSFFQFNPQLRRYLFSVRMIFFWFFGVVVIIQAILNYLWLVFPLNFLISLGLLFFYLILFFLVLRNTITAEKAAIERSQIQAIILSIENPVVSYTQDFEIILVNLPFEHLVGLKKEQLVGKIITPELVNDSQYGFLTKLFFPTLAPLILERSSGGFPQKIKLQFNEPKELILEITTTKVIDENGNNFGFLKIINDLTHQETIKKIQSDFISITAHQLRTPVTSLNWFLESLLKKEFGNLNENQEKIITDGLKSVGEIQNTVELLLNISQLEEGKFGFQFKETNLEVIIEEVLTKYEQTAKINNIRLSFYRPSVKIPSIKADIQRIKTVIEILVDNAIRYNYPKGEVRVFLRQLPDVPFVEISVEDTGIGITAEEMPRLFTKFFRSQEVVKKAISGIGLGLYLAKNIVKRHGGDIWAKSDIGRGSLFAFTLPTDPSYLPPQ